MSKSKPKSFYLEEKIIDRAKASFGKEVTKENYAKWEAHWLKTAEELKKELLAEGLTTSAEYVNQCIITNKCMSKTFATTKR